MGGREIGGVCSNQNVRYSHMKLSYDKSFLMISPSVVVSAYNSSTWKATARGTAWAVVSLRHTGLQSENPFQRQNPRTTTTKPLASPLVHFPCPQGCESCLDSDFLIWRDVTKLVLEALLEDEKDPSWNLLEKQRGMCLELLVAYELGSFWMRSPSWGPSAQVSWPPDVSVCPFCPAGYLSPCHDRSEELSRWPILPSG